MSEAAEPHVPEVIPDDTDEALDAELKRLRKEDQLPAAPAASAPPATRPNTAQMDIVSAAKEEIATQQALHELIEELINKILSPGEDFGIAHDKGCRERLKEREGQRPFAGPGRCDACGRKPDLWLPGAERIAKRLGYYYGEPEVATDIMEAIQGIEAPWIAFRVAVIDRKTGEVVGYGVGARSLLQNKGDQNAMIKMAKKSAIIDACKTTFALSGFFTQDSPGGKDEVPAKTPPATTPVGAQPPAPTPAPAGGVPAAPATPSPAPAPSQVPNAPADPNKVPDRATPNLDGVIQACGLTSGDMHELYKLAGYTDGEVTPAIARAACNLVHGSFKAFVADAGGWPEGITPAQARERFFLPWVQSLQPAAPTQAPAPAPGQPPAGIVVERARDRTTEPPAKDHPIPIQSLDSYKRAFAIDLPTQERICQALGFDLGQPLNDEQKQRVFRLLHDDLHKWVQTTSITSKDYVGWTPEERRNYIIYPFLEDFTKANNAQ